MKKYIKPEVEIVDFTAENITVDIISGEDTPPIEE